MNSANDLKMSLKLWRTLSNLGLKQRTMEYAMYDSLMRSINTRSVVLRDVSGL